MAGFWKSGAEGEAQVERLKEMVRENLSFSQIAAAMGASSRNVVLCKFNRLRKQDPTLQHPSAPSAPRVPRPNAPRQTAAARPLPPPTISATELVPMTIDGEPITIFNVGKNQCEYPYGDPTDPDYHYCGHPTKEGSHYCAPHHAKCYQPKTPPKLNIGHRGRKRS